MSTIKIRAAIDFCQVLLLGHQPHVYTVVKARFCVFKAPEKETKCKREREKERESRKANGERASNRPVASLLVHHLLRGLYSVFFLLSVNFLLLVRLPHLPCLMLFCCLLYLV